MKTIDIYYRFERYDLNIKTRFKLVYCSEEYKPLHNKGNKGEIKVGISTHDYVKTNKSNKAVSKLKQNENHITSLYFFDVKHPELASGDIYKTLDALLFIISENVIEI